MPERGSEVVDVEVEVTVERDLSYKVISCQTSRAAWLPKSAVELHDYDTKTQLGVMTIPTNMAKEKGLI